MIKILLQASHFRPASETPFKMAFRWRVDDWPILNAYRFSGDLDHFCLKRIW